MFNNKRKHSIHIILFYFLTVLMFFHFIPKSTANSVYAGRFLGFSVYVSNSTNKEEGFLCYHDTNYTVTDIPPELTVPCDVQGRYVIYYNSRKSGLSPRFGYSGKAFINLCEVEVYGKTSDTSYFLHLKTSVKNWNFWIDKRGICTFKDKS